MAFNNLSRLTKDKLEYIIFLISTLGNLASKIPVN